MKTKWVLAAATLLLPPILVGQDIAKLFPVTHSGDEWFAQNASKKAVTAYVYHVGGGALHVSPDINFAPVELRHSPIAPGAKVKVPVKPNFTMLEVIAVVFDDGSVLGSARTTGGIDVVEDLIFAIRRNELSEYKRLLDLLEKTSDHVQAVASVVHDAANPQLPVHDNETAIRQSVQSIVANWLSNAKTSYGDEYSEDWYKYLHDNLTEQIAAAEKFCVRRAQ